MEPSRLRDEARAQMTPLEKRAFRMGGVSKMKVRGNDLGGDETKMTAEVD